MLSTLPTIAMAQGEEEKSLGFVYATYFYCDAGKAERADEIVKKIDAPNFEKAVDDGTIQSWGWIAHHTGGLWRRLQYYSAPTLNGLLDAQEAMQGDRDAKTEKLADEFGSICNAHQDYIWERLAGSRGSGDDSSGAASFSVYYVCDESREERADEIFKNDFAPIFDKFVEDGKIANWGWMSHWVGGKYRRLQTVSGSDHKSLLAARGELIEAMYGDDNEAGAEFTSICGSHEDYMWDVQIEKP
jgi:hypothetical protein